MNSHEIRMLCSRVTSFEGVYPLDLYISRKQRRDICVVNTDVSSQPGEHWFVIDTSVSPPFVFDSYGVKGPFIAKDLWYSVFKQIQSSTLVLQGPTTNVCGDYCVVYAILRERKFPPEKIEHLLFNLSNSTHQRDHIIREYISKEIRRTRSANK